MELPVEITTTPDTAVSQDDEEEPDTAVSAKILIIDDEELILTVLSQILQAHQVEKAQNGRDALDKIADADYDLILCDIYMPGISGIELYQKLQATDPAQAARMIFMTGDTVSPRTKTFLDQTGVETLSKPFEIPTLLATVNKLL